MSFKRILTIGLLACFGTTYAQQTEYHFFVQFIDKGLNYVDIGQPEKFMTQRSLDRRKRQQIEIDSFDLPVTAAYVDNITKPSIKVRYVTKWLNGAVITTTSMDSAYRLKIKFFVDKVTYLGKSTVRTDRKGSKSTEPTETDDVKQKYGDGYQQLEMIQGTKLHSAGYKGKGMLIAVLDAGFKRVNTLSLFEKLYQNNQVRYAYDVVDLENDVYKDDDHGLHVLGCLAANKDGQMIGSAPEADYILLRTESAKYENLLEELNWVRAAEIADSMGVDVINSSLGYNTFDEDILDHEHSDLDGKTTFISRGAAVAAKRGILVVNSAGNDGNKSWGKIDFPADVEDLLVVGAVDNDLEPTAFSSPGPTADFRVKPDVVALGKNTTIGTTYGVGTGNGTSYSCPIVAGMAACLWQSNPDLNAQDIRKIIIHSSHAYPNADNAIGYGLPDFDLALAMTGKKDAFNYNQTAVVDPPSRPLKQQESFVLFAPKDSLVLCDVKLRRKFLFIPYKKKKGTFESEINPYGFGRMPVLLFNIPSGKTVEFEFYRLDNDGKRKNFSLYSGKMK